MPFPKSPGRKRPTNKLSKKQMESLMDKLLKSKTTIKQRVQGKQEQSFMGADHVRASQADAGSIFDVE